MILMTCLQETYLLRQMISADVEGSVTSFLVGAEPFAGGGTGAEGEQLPLPVPLASASTSACVLFFLRAMGARVQGRW